MTAPHNDVDEFFGGAKSISFKDPTTRGVPRGGRIIGEAKKVQQRNFETGKPEFWDDGNPKWQVAVTLDTRAGKYPESDPTVPNDDGIRRLFIKGQMQSAVGKALRDAQAPGLRDGGFLYVCWTDNKPTKGYDQKLYVAQYETPAPGYATDNVFGNTAAPTAPATQPPVQQPPVQQPPVQQPPVQVPVQQAASAADPWANTPPAQAPVAAPNPFA